VTCIGTAVSEQCVAQNTAWGNVGYRFHCSLETSVVCQNMDMLIFSPEHLTIPSGVVYDGTLHYLICISLDLFVWFKDLFSIFI
jgi:hypothetical protein